jgi:hypothetical protein
MPLKTLITIKMFFPQQKRQKQLRHVAASDRIHRAEDFRNLRITLFFFY